MHYEVFSSVNCGFLMDCIKEWVVLDRYSLYEVRNDDVYWLVMNYNGSSLAKLTSDINFIKDFIMNHECLMIYLPYIYAGNLAIIYDDQKFKVYYVGKPCVHPYMVYFNATCISELLGRYIDKIVLLKQDLSYPEFDAFINELTYAHGIYITDQLNQSFTLYTFGDDYKFLCVDLQGFTFTGSDGITMRYNYGVMVMEITKLPYHAHDFLISSISGRPLPEIRMNEKYNDMC